MKVNIDKPRLRVLTGQSSYQVMQEATSNEHSVRQIKNLASAVSTKLFLNHGNQFVAMIGHGDEPTNTEAIVTWLKNRYHLYAHLSSTERLRKACADLKAHILKTLDND